MPTSSLRRGIEPVLNRIEERILAAEGRLAAGSPRERVAAAGELEFLKRQKAALESRLADLENRPEGAWERAREWLHEEAGMLEGRVEAWLARN